MNDALQLALAAAGVVSVAQSPELKGRVDAARKRGEIQRLLPGTYAVGSTLEERLCAAAAWDPDHILLGAAAAKVGWWAEAKVEDVAVSTKRNVKSTFLGFDIQRLQIPDELVWEHRGFRLVSPAASVLQLLPEIGPIAIDEALRRRAVSIESLRWTLARMPARPGNVLAARLIEDSRDEPWSPLEREAHALLRSAGIKGWRANYPVSLPSGVAFLDVALPASRIAFEFDGWQFHRSREQFVDDRWRDVELQLDGWRTFRFTGETLPRLPEVARRLSGLRRG